MGFPIRKSLDQSPFAAPQGLSQRTTSFIASQHQGIHRTPLRHLIALITNAHQTVNPANPLAGERRATLRPSAEADASITKRHGGHRSIKTLCFKRIPPGF